MVVGKDGQAPGTVLADPIAQIDAFGDLLRCGIAEHIFHGTNGHPRFAADILLAILDVVELFEHRHRDDDVVFLKGVDGEGFMQQNIGIENEEFAIVALHRQPPWVARDPVDDTRVSIKTQPDDRAMTSPYAPAHRAATGAKQFA